MGLQAKKNVMRKAIAERGVLQRGGTNEYDKYKYFTEAQYKQLFTSLASEAGVELTATTVNVEHFQGSEKMPYGRRVTVDFVLKDTATDETETSRFVGEALDKGDKAIYKAYTGAFKYFLAVVFAVATGDDPETSGAEQEPEPYITQKQIGILTAMYGGQDNPKLLKLLASNNITELKKMPFNVAVDLIEKLEKAQREAQRKKAIHELSEEPSYGEIHGDDLMGENT